MEYPTKNNLVFAAYIQAANLKGYAIWAPGFRNRT